MNKPKNVILGLTRNVAIDSICRIIDCLQDQGYFVTVVSAEAGQKTAKADMLEKLTGNKVYCGLFDEPQGWDVEHISLAQKADLVLIAPPDRAMVNKIACGICDDLLTCVVCATKAPVAFLGQTDKAMRSDVEKLQSLGYKFISTEKSVF